MLSTWLLAGALAASGCGSSTPSGPTEPSPKPGGSFTGRYVLELRPAASCMATGLGGGAALARRAPAHEIENRVRSAVALATSVTVPLTAAPGGSSPHPGVQLVLEGADPGLIELELKYTDFTLDGGFGTTGDGVASDQGPQLWVNAIGTASVNPASDGRGEVLSGSLRGYLEIEGMNACTATNHSFTLRPR